MSGLWGEFEGDDSTNNGAALLKKSDFSLSNYSISTSEVIPPPVIEINDREHLDR